MKLKDVLGKVIKNKKNGQLNTSLKKNALKKAGINEEDFFNLKIDFKLKKLMEEK